MEGTLATVMLFAANWAPRNWAICNGALLPIAQNQALFSLIGTLYGGDGRTTFALPDLRGRVPVGFGNGPGLRDYRAGQQLGSESNVLSVNQMPAHTHNLAGVSVSIPVSEEDANTGEAAGNYLANGNFYHQGSDGTYGGGPLPLTGQMMPAGGGQPVNNMQPSLAMNYIICMNGLFPSRN